ncbi:MAG: TrpB-like pyridoxal phosphate-dependent enzyme [Caldimicrobium sp.]
MKILLNAEEMPRFWLNLVPYLPEPLSPPLHPQTKEPISPKDLLGIFSEPIIEQEVSTEEWIEIPHEIREVYALWRPTPLIRAINLEKVLDTPAEIYYKYEGVSPPGSHKPNTAVAQAYFNKIAGVKKLTTETGAGQWGSSLAFATQYFGLECEVYMVRASYHQKPYRKILMELWGATVYPSPSQNTQTGRTFLQKDKDHPGSLGIAISEAIERALEEKNTKYSLGSVLNHVLLHQTIIGLEAERQMEKINRYPDFVIGCVGGGSNFAGLAFPYLKRKITGEKPNTEFWAIEPEACPTLTKGEYRYDFGDTAGLTPLVKMYTLGADFIPPPIHAGGLRYHGDAPLLCAFYHHGYIKACAYSQSEIFSAGVLFAKTEGIVPAPESAHAVKKAIDLALECKQRKEKKIILFNLSGHGYFDLSAYESYLKGEIN